MVYPGGVYLAGPFSDWLWTNDVIDGIDGAAERAAELIGIETDVLISALGTVAPIDGPDGEKLLAAAIRDHQGNARLEQILPGADTTDRPSWVETLVPNHRREIEASGVPILVQAGWHDTGTAAGTLQRFGSFSNHQEVWLGPWSHGGDSVIVPGGDADIPDFEDLSAEDQLERIGEFFDRFVRDGDAPSGEKLLRFTTVGGDGWTETPDWPLPTTTDLTLYLSAAGLAGLPPEAESVLPLPSQPHTSGDSTRWIMNVAGGLVDYSDWGENADSRSAITGAVLAADTWICGFPVVSVDLVSDQSDGVLHVYLEHLSPEDEVHYLSEGLLRLSQPGPTPPEQQTAFPLERTFASGDMAPFPIGEATRLALDLFPVSVIVPARHRLQLSFASTDTDNFASYAEPAAVTYLLLPQTNPALLLLPVLEH